MNKELEYNPILDYVKFILSIFIILLHQGSYAHDICPYVRVVVPLFFMISSYLFFIKYDNISDPKLKKKQLFKFIKSNLILYLFWFILSLPMTLEIRHNLWFKDNFLLGLEGFLKSFFLGSTFVASWFLMALIIGVPLIAFLSKYLKNILTFIIALLAFILCVLTSSYYPYLNGFFLEIKHFAEPCFTFLAGLIWIYLGKNINYIKDKVNIVFVILMIVASIFGLYYESEYVYSLTNRVTNDVYFMLLLLAPLLFILILKIPYNSNHKKISYYFRKSSTVMFVVHGNLLRYIWRFEKMNSIVINPIGEIMLIIGICLTLTLLLILLQKCKYFKWIKYAY